MINQRVARAFVRVHRPGALTFAASSEVGVGGRRVDCGHRLNSHSKYCESGSCAWGSGVCARARCVGKQQHIKDSGSRAWGSGACARCVEQQQHIKLECVRARRVEQQQQHITGVYLDKKPVNFGPHFLVNESETR